MCQPDRNHKLPPTASSNFRSELNFAVYENDVLFGRNKNAHSHTGNKRFRQLIQELRQEYQDAHFRQEKSIITLKIIDIICTIRGGRFLKYDANEGWQCVSETDRYEKVSHALRSARAPACQPLMKKEVKEKDDIPVHLDHRKEAPVEEEIMKEDNIPVHRDHRKGAHISFKTLIQEQQRLFRMLVDSERKDKAESHELANCDDGAPHPLTNFDSNGFEDFDEESVRMLCGVLDIEDI